MKAYLSALFTIMLVNLGRNLEDPPKLYRYQGILKGESVVAAIIKPAK